MLPNREGQRVPNVTFHTRTSNEWLDITTDELFAGKTVIVFSLPGAFTPYLFFDPPAGLQRPSQRCLKPTGSMTLSACRSTIPS